MAHNLFCSSRNQCKAGTALILNHTTGLIEDMEVEGMLGLVEARLRKLHFRSTNVTQLPVTQMLSNHYLFGGRGAKQLKSVSSLCKQGEIIFIGSV